MPSSAGTSALDSLVEPGAELRRLGENYQFTEGPVWSVREQCLYFSDIPGDTRWRWTESDGMEVVRSPSCKANGLVLDLDGELVACDQVTSMVVRYRRDGGTDVLAYHHRGAYLNSPNDIVTRAADGALYFTDPDFGRWNDWIGQERSRTMGYRGLYRVATTGGDGEAELLVDPGEFDQPNGLCFSPDETLLYVNDSPRAHIKVFDVADDGSLSNGRMFFDGVGTGVIEEGIPDGMKCDERGNIWVTGPGGVWVISPGGEHLGTVLVPENVGNHSWGGPDWHTLFIPSSTSVYTIRTTVGPRREPYMA